MKPRRFKTYKFKTKTSQGENMKTIFKIMTITIFTFMFVFAAQAKTVNVTDFGAVANDDTDDTEAVKQAVQDLLENGGGNLVFPAGVTDIQEEIVFAPRGLVSFRLSGDKGSYIKLNGSPATNYFVFENAIQAEVESLNFIGDTNTVMNAQRVIWAKKGSQTTISRCAFFDVGAVAAIVEFNDTAAVVENTIFYGSAAQESAVVTRSAKSLTVNNTTFKNEGEYLNTTARKASDIRPENWVKVENPVSVGKGTVRIKDSFFDSAAVKSIRIEDQMSATLDGLTVNVTLSKFGAGVSLKNVSYAETLNSTFGFPNLPRPAFEIRNGSYLEVNAVTLTDLVRFGDSDANSGYQIRYCPTCNVTPSKARK